MAREKIARVAAVVDTPTLEVVDRRRDPADGFMKYLFALADGARVEAVRIPIFDDKYTLCLSSQAGCPLDCVFCATGRLGFTRNLATWEIVEQLRIVRDEADRPRARRRVHGHGRAVPQLRQRHPRGAHLRRSVGRRHQRARHHHLDRRAWCRRSAASPTRAIRIAWPSRSTRRDARAPPLAHAGGREDLAHRRAHRRRARARGGDAPARDARVRGHPRRQLRRRRCRGARASCLRGIPVRLNLIDVNDATRPLRSRRATTSGAPSSTRCSRSERRSCAATRAARTSTPRAACSPPPPSALATATQPLDGFDGAHVRRRRAPAARRRRDPRRMCAGLRGAGQRQHADVEREAEDHLRDGAAAPLGDALDARRGELAPIRGQAARSPGRRSRARGRTRAPRDPSPCARSSGSARTPASPRFRATARRAARATRC